MRRQGIATQKQQLLVILFSILTQASVLATDTYEIVGKVPFRLRDHFILVSGSIGKCRHLSFAVDTGSAYTVLSERVAKILDLEGEPVQVSVFGTDMTVTKISVNQLFLRDVRFQEIEARISHLPPVKGVRLDGLIGLDLLKRSTVTLDFKHNEILFGQGRNLPYSARFYSRLSFIPVTIKIEGEFLYLSLDTGISGLMLYQTEIEERLPIRHTNRVESYHHAGGMMEIEQVILRDVSLGGASWKELPAYLIAGQKSPNRYIAGNLGVFSLGFEVLQVDFETGHLSWKP